MLECSTRVEPDALLRVFVRQEKSILKSNDQLFNQLINKSTNRRMFITKTSINRSISQTNSPFGQSINQNVQSINQSTRLSIYPLQRKIINQQFDLKIYQSPNQTNNRYINQSTNQKDNQPIKQSTTKSSDYLCWGTESLDLCQLFSEGCASVHNCRLNKQNNN